MTEVMVLDEAQVRTLIDRPAALAATREAFLRLARGAVEQPDVLSLDLVERHGAETEITVADLTGVGAVDAMVANHVTARALREHVGSTLAA